jgi:NitT/TauT family transport system ATP-binding protein
MSTQKPVLRIINVTKRFTTPATTLLALDAINLDINPGEFVSIIGPSGCGKSTLMNVIGGLISADEGEVLLDGAPSSRSRRSIGMIFQEESTFPWRTTLENVTFPLEAAGMHKPERVARALELIGMVGLKGFEHSYPAQLSGGMRQRTTIARTLAFRPRLLLMDEPFASLDEQTRLLLGDHVLRIQQELKQTTLLITHNLTEAVQLSDRVVVMTYRPGRIKRIVDIDLPRPRSSQLVSSEEFGRFVGTIWNDLREEASRGMHDAESRPPPDRRC